MDAAGEHVGRLYGHIYAVVRRIPRGLVATYGQVAELAGIPRGARVAGTALRVSTPEMGLPWHRVVGKRSRATASVSIHDPVGAAVQRGLLEDEGVEFTPAGGIALARFGWLPRERARPRPARKSRKARKAR
jgi:methylated-DNA-protein-cysteine methyltransferase-like protein